MGFYKEIEGDLIKLAKEGNFDVIAHGANCFCRMKRGLAPQMAEAFGCDRYNLEGDSYKEDINKLGNIDYEIRHIHHNGKILNPKGIHNENDVASVLVIINAYTQYNWDTATKPLDYAAFRTLFEKNKFYL